KLLHEKALVVALTIGGESAAALAAQMAKDLGAEIDREAAALLADIVNEEPAGIVGALAWMYRKLIEARDLPAHTNGFQAARQLGMRPEAAEAAVRQA